MGSTSLNREKGTSNREWFAEHFEMNAYPAVIPDDHVTAVRVMPHKRTILECATTNGIFYAAVRDEETGEVWALVVKTWWGRGYFNFTYKDMDETMGPGYAEAPAKVLDALTPTEHEYAISWRADCRALLERRAKARKVKPGDTLVFPHKIGFVDHVDEDTFTFVKGDSMRRVSDGCCVRFRGWRTRQFEIQEAS